jgi:hypothetical protein
LLLLPFPPLLDMVHTPAIVYDLAKQARCVSICCDAHMSQLAALKLLCMIEQVN